MPADPSPPTDSAPTGAKRILMPAIKFLLTAVVLLFVGKQVLEHWDQVKGFDWQISWLHLLGSFLFAHLGLVVFSYAWKKIMQGLGYEITTYTGYRVFNLATLGRYVPGKIWQVMGMLYLLKREGVKGEHAAASFVLFQVFTIPASLLVYVVAVQFEASLFSPKLLGSGQEWAYILGGIGVLGCLALVIWPRPFLMLVNWLLGKLKRPMIAERFDKRVALHSFVAYFLGWIAYGIAFWLFLVSILGDTAPSAIAAIGLYNIAYQIGYLVLFAPGGFGPRELIMGVLLSQYIGSIGPMVAVAARLWSVAVESSAALVALGMKKRS